jgi:hypothetical protein
LLEDFLAEAFLDEPPEDFFDEPPEDFLLLPPLDFLPAAFFLVAIVKKFVVQY